MNGFDNFTQSVNAAAVALKGLEGPAQESADAIDQAFSKAGESLARSLGRAASDGKISMAELASAVISAVNAAGRSSGGGLGDVLSGIGSVFSGARADGGPVTRGGAYLVGERGPELFRPATSGSIETGAGGQQVNITLNVSGGGEGLIRSEAQIASALNRAARLGLR
jgi:phage-related minor tail protein